VIAKKLHQRAIYIYKHNKIFKKGYYYNIIVSAIANYKGNKEIVSIKDATRLQKIKNIKNYFLHYKKGMDLSDKKYLNEVIYKLSGLYKKGYLYYDKSKKIRVYNKIKRFYIKDFSHLKLKQVRIQSYKNDTEVILYYKRQIKN